MQIDMHYYGTYVLARAAGINEAIAHIIATASQFVDDSVETIQECVFKDRSRLSQVVTAHHTLSIANTSKDDQRYVWVPFHFLPGGGDSTDDPFEKRLICRRNSRSEVNRNLYHFYQGAEFHRTYVLRELLPEHGIYVI